MDKLSPEKYMKYFQYSLRCFCPNATHVEAPIVKDMPAELHTFHYSNIQAHIYIYTCVYIHIYVCVYAHTYPHVCTHTHTHNTDIQTKLFSPRKLGKSNDSTFSLPLF